MNIEERKKVSDERTKYLRTLVQWIEQRLINPSFVITHRLSLEDAPHGYEKMFGKKQDQCIKVVLKP